MDVNSKVRLLLVCVVVLITALAIFSLTRGGNSHKSETVLSAPPAVLRDGKRGGTGSAVDPVISVLRTTRVANEDGSAAAPPDETSPQPRLKAASWMSSRDAAYAVTPEARLNEILQLRMGVASAEQNSFFQMQYMTALASVALATHLDELGRSTTSPVEPGAYQWKFATGGAFYIVEHGKYPAFDAVLMAHEDAAQDVTANAGGGDNISTDTTGPGPSLKIAKPIPDATHEHLNTLVESAIALLTTYE